jgi:hypothetical protein
LSVDSTSSEEVEHVSSRTGPTSRKLPGIPPPTAPTGLPTLHPSADPSVQIYQRCPGRSGFKVCVRVVVRDGPHGARMRIRNENAEVDRHRAKSTFCCLVQFRSQDSRTEHTHTHTPGTPLIAVSMCFADRTQIVCDTMYESIRCCYVVVDQHPRILVFVCVCMHVAIRRLCVARRFLMCVRADPELVRKCSPMCFRIENIRCRDDAFGCRMGLHGAVG